jgi:hypothetical protein
VPGSFWQGRMLPEERDKVYKCTIVDFSLAHKFAPDSSPRMALLQQTKKLLTLCLMSSSGGRTRISRSTHST